MNDASVLDNFLHVFGMSFWRERFLFGKVLFISLFVLRVKDLFSLISGVCIVTLSRAIYRQNPMKALFRITLIFIATGLLIPAVSAQSLGKQIPPEITDGALYNQAYLEMVG